MFPPIAQSSHSLSCLGGCTPDLDLPIPLQEGTCTY